MTSGLCQKNNLIDKKTRNIMWLPSSFKDCPYCKTYNSLGTLFSKSHPSLLEICKICNHSITHPLPSLDKKVLYLDQFFISNVLKNRGPNNLFFQKTYEQLRKLSRLQVMICPYSWFHKTESLHISKPNSLQKIYELLANGISFYDPASIYKHEIIYKLLEVFNTGKALTIDDILYGFRNNWSTSYIASTPLTDIDSNHKNEINALEHIKKNNLVILEKFFQNCIQNYDKKLNTKQYYKKIYDKIIDELRDSYLQDDAFLNDLKMHLYTQLPKYLEIDPIKDFLKKYIKTLPSVKIMAHLVASLAHRYVFAGRKKRIDPSLLNDINMVSSILPHCDAIFIDKELYELLKNYPGYQNKLFSLNNKNDFLNYLKDLEEKVSAFHKELIAEIYPSDEKLSN
jgi:transcription elongation factor Elf1